VVHHFQFVQSVCVSVVMVKEQPCVWFKLYRTWYCVYFLFNKLSFSVMKPSLYILYSRSRRISVQLVARYFGPTGAEMPSLVNAGKNFFLLGSKGRCGKKKSYWITISPLCFILCCWRVINPKRGGIAYLAANGKNKQGIYGGVCGCNQLLLLHVLVTRYSHDQIYKTYR
jgi:hypothetical protein